MYFPWTLWVVADVFNRFPEVEWISTLKTGFWDWSGLCLGFEDNRGFSKEAFLDGYNLPAVAQPKTFIPAGYRTCIQQESTFWRRSLWEKAGGYVSHEFGSAGDFELWCRFYRHTDLHGVNAPLSGFRYQNQQQTSQMNKYAQYCLPALEQMRKDLHWSPSPARRLGYGVRPWSRPLLRKFKYNSIAYEGKRIARSNFNSPDAAWIKESHLFH